MANLGNTIVNGVLRVLNGLKVNTVNGLITGLGTVGQDMGSGVSPRYFPAKWTFNINHTFVEGDMITIKTPCAGHDYGIFISVDNGANYKPIRFDYGTGRLSTHYNSGSYLTLIYTPNNTVNSVYAVTGADARSNITGCWTVLNNYDANTTPAAYCTSSATIAAKTATCSNYNLLANTYIHVLISNSNTYNGAITLNINGKGAKPIYINGTASSSSNKTLPAGTYLVFYNGTNYYFRTDGKLTSTGLVNTSNASLIPSVENVLSSTSTTNALSAAQGKALDDKINNWTPEQTLSEDATSVTFTGLTSGYAYDLYSETADGSPIQIVNYVVSGTQITYTISAVTAAQVGQSGTGCRVKLKCMY